MRMTIFHTLWSITWRILLHPLSKHPIASLFEWFKNNLFKSNADKCHLFVITNYRASISVDGFQIDKSDTEKLLGVKFDKKLTFDYHISDICKKAGRKISG